MKSYEIIEFTLFILNLAFLFSTNIYFCMLGCFALLFTVGILIKSNLKGKFLITFLLLSNINYIVFEYCFLKNSNGKCKG